VSLTKRCHLAGIARLGFKSLARGALSPWTASTEGWGAAGVILPRLLFALFAMSAQAVRRSRIRSGRKP